MLQGAARVQNLVKISENEERKIEDRLLAIEAAIHSILKTLKHHSNAISKLQIFIFLQNCEDPGMMEVFLRLFMEKKNQSTGQPVNKGVNHGKM